MRCPLKNLLHRCSSSRPDCQENFARLWRENILQATANSAEIELTRNSPEPGIVPEGMPGDALKARPVSPRSSTPVSHRETISGRQVVENLRTVLGALPRFQSLGRPIVKRHFQPLHRLLHDDVQAPLLKIRLPQTNTGLTLLISAKNGIGCGRA